MKWVDIEQEDLPVYETARMRKLKRAYRLKPSQRLEQLLRAEYLKELNERMNG